LEKTPKQKKFKKPLKFKSNHLIVSNVDIISQEPVDTKMRKILNESMKLSLETHLKIQEAEAKHRQNLANQDAKGRIERKKLGDDTENEERRLNLLQLEATNESIKTTGLAEASAIAKSKEEEIKSSMDLEKAKLDFEAEKLMKTVQLEFKKKSLEKEIDHLKKMTELDVERAQKLADSEIQKVETMVKALGKETLVELAKAGPETQSKILKSLGVKSLLVTDGKNPVNLFNTAEGLIGPNQLMMNK